jgi:hypothetical protein
MKRSIQNIGIYRRLSKVALQLIGIPVIQGDFGSGVITIRKDQRELVLDFTKE